MPPLVAAYGDVPARAELRARLAEIEAAVPATISSVHRTKAGAYIALRRNAQDNQASEQAETRRNMVGTGDRSDRIRTYNFPQGRMTDHRINLTLYKLDEVMEGELDSIIGPLRQEYQADQLAALSDN